MTQKANRRFFKAEARLRSRPVHFMVVRLALGQFPPPPPRVVCFPPVGIIRPMLLARFHNTARVRMTGERSPETFKVNLFRIKEHWLYVHFHFPYGLQKVTRAFG
jgi:hypothetical protein